MGHFLHFSDAVSMAFHGATLLAYEPKRTWAASEIAFVFDVSHAHLAKVLQRLSRAGIVRAMRGPKGGYRLARPAEDVTLLNVYEAIEGPYKQHDCLLWSMRCLGDRCLLGDLVPKISDQIYEYLESTRLTDVTHVYDGMDFTKKH